MASLGSQPTEHQGGLFTPQFIVPDQAWRLPGAIKTQLKAPRAPTRGISFPLLCLYGIREVESGFSIQPVVHCRQNQSVLSDGMEWSGSGPITALADE